MIQETTGDLLKSEMDSNPSKLTPARAMLLYALFYYETLGEYSNLFVANKLAYFFKRLGVSDFQKLNFKGHFYGPYSEQVIPILHNLNGVYLKGLEQMNVKPFETIELLYEQKEAISKYIRKEITAEKRQQLKNLIGLVEGFQSPHALEILASVDYLLKENPNATLEEVTNAIQSWNRRKKELFKPQQIKVVYEHLKNYQTTLELYH
jgi:uncharacterized protein YwgA